MKIYLTIIVLQLVRWVLAKNLYETVKDITEDQVNLRSLMQNIRRDGGNQTALMLFGDSILMGFGATI